jgi:hypothetical protein
MCDSPADHTSEVLMTRPARGSHEPNFGSAVYEPVGPQAVPPATAQSPADAARERATRATVLAERAKQKAG